MNAELFNPLMLAAVNAAGGTNSPASGSFWTTEQIFGLFEKYGTKALAAILVFVAGALVARRVGNILHSTLSKRDMEPPLRNLLVRFGKLAVMVLAILIAIQQLGFQLWPLIAGFGVAGVGVGLAMQGVLGNLVAGLTIIFVKKFRVGEYIEINGVQGVVDNIELFSTTLVHPDLSRVIVPNRKIVGEIIHNYGKVRQASLSVGVSYDTDLNEALELIKGILQRNPRVLKDPAPGVSISTLGDSSIVIAVKPWSALADFGSMQAELNKAIVEGLRVAGIEIPFPQREVRVLQAAELKSVA